MGLKVVKKKKKESRKKEIIKIRARRVLQRRIAVVAYILFVVVYMVM